MSGVPSLWLTLVDGPAGTEMLEGDVFSEIIASGNGAAHFQVISVLGNGNFGIVFKVRTVRGGCLCLCVEVVVAVVVVVCVRVCVSICVNATAVVGVSAGALHTSAAPVPAQAVRPEARHQLRDHVKNRVDCASVRPGLRCAAASAASHQPMLATGGVYE